MAKNDDQISEIDMNSDARSMHSAQLGHAKLPLKKHNNLMGTGNEFYQSNNRFNSSLNEVGWGGASQLSDSRGLLDAQSNFGGSANGSNMFHPRDRRDSESAMNAQKEKLREAARLKEIEKKKIAEEWGFSNPATMQVWEAR